MMKSIILFTVALLPFFAMSQNNEYKAADKLLNEKHYTESIRICTDEINKLNQKDTLFIKFLHLRADSYLESSQYDLSIKDYLTLIDLNPKEASYYGTVAYLYGENQDYDNCLAILKQGFAVAPKNDLLLNNYCYYSNLVGNFQDGLNFANKGLSATNDKMMQGSLLNNRGYSYIGLKKYDLALNDINESIKLNPDNPFAYCYRAIANVGLKKFETVCDDLNKAKSMGGINLTADLIKQYCH